MRHNFTMLCILGICATLLFSSCAPVHASLPTVTLTPNLDISKQQLISEVIPLLDVGTSKSYAEAWNKLRPFGSYKGKFWNDEEIQALLWFSYNMINVVNGSLHSDDFSLISPDYDGIYHEQMSAEILKHINRSEWTRRYELNSPMMATVIAKARQALP